MKKELIKYKAGATRL